MGKQLSEWFTDEGSELYEVTFQPATVGTFPDPKYELKNITENSAALIQQSGKMCDLGGGVVWRWVKGCLLG